MKRFFFFLFFLNAGFSLFLMCQTYEDGFRHYKNANVARIMKDNVLEEKELTDAHTIFKSLATKNDYESLLMYYLVSQKLQKPFSLNDDLFYYVKDESPNYTTIKRMKLLSNDESFVFDKLKEIAGANEKEANRLVSEAKKDALMDQYRAALDKLEKAAKLWHITEIVSLRNKYETQLKKKPGRLAIVRIRDLIRQSQFRNALQELNYASPNISIPQFNQLDTEIRDGLSTQLIREGKKEYKKRSYYTALDKFTEAYRIHPSDQVTKITNKYRKKIKARQKQRKLAVFCNWGIPGPLKIGTMQYNGTGNTTTVADITESGSVETQLSHKNNGFGFGIIKMISPSIGVSASVSFFKQEVSTHTHFKLFWIWKNGVSASGTGTMDDTGEMSMIPININLLKRAKLLKDFNVVMYAGPTLFLTSVSVWSRIASGGVWDTGGNPAYVPGWFPFRYEIKDSHSYIGGNVGLNLEYKIRYNIGVYLGLQYFFAPNKNRRWRIVPGSYPGLFRAQNLVADTNEFEKLPAYFGNMKISTYRMQVGVTYYL